MSALRRALVSEAVGRELLRSVSERLAAAGIDVMPLKGVWLQRCVYPEAGMRAVTDVDVLVREGDYARALAVLAEDGWEARSWNVSETALRHGQWALPLDLHRRLFTPGVYRLREGELFARARVDTVSFGARVLLPDVADMLAHLVGHFVKSRRRPEDAHATRDFAVLGQAPGFDAEACARRLHDAGMGRASRYAFSGLVGAGSEPYGRLVAALPRDVTGRLLVSLGRRIAERPSARARFGAVPGFLLDRTLSAGAYALLRRVGDLPLERSMLTNPRAAGV